jgi:hypothetical protein
MQGRAEQKNRELSDVKARFWSGRRQANNYKRRVDVIDSLRAGQAGSRQFAGHAGRDSERNRSGLAEQDG